MRRGDGGGAGGASAGDGDAKVFDAQPAPAPAPLEPLEMPEVGTWLEGEDRGHWYRAQVVKTREGEVFLHWKGFKKSHRRWVPLVHARIRFAPPVTAEEPPPAAEEQEQEPKEPKEGGEGEEEAPAGREGIGVDDVAQTEEEEVPQPEAEAASPPMELAPPLSPSAVSVGQVVRVFEYGKWWDAKVLALGDVGSPHEREVKVHFKGWKSRWDAWVELGGGYIKVPSPYRSPRNHASTAAADAAVVSAVKPPPEDAADAAPGGGGAGEGAPPRSAAARSSSCPTRRRRPRRPSRR